MFFFIRKRCLCVQLNKSHVCGVFIKIQTQASKATCTHLLPIHSCFPRHRYGLISDQNILLTPEHRDPKSRQDNRQRRMTSSIRCCVFSVVNNTLLTSKTHLHPCLGQCVLTEPTDVWLTSAPVDGMCRCIHGIDLAIAASFFT